MAVISDFEEEKPSPSSSSATNSAADEEVLASILAKKGPVGFLEAAIDLVQKKSDLFKDDAAVRKVMAAVSAAKEKEDAEKRRKEEEERREEAERKKKRDEDKAKAKAAAAAAEKMEVDKEEEKEEAAEANGESMARKPNAGNGLDMEKYSWTQNLQEVTINIPVPAGTKSRFVVYELKKNHLKVGLKGRPPIIDGELHQSVRVDDCFCPTAQTYKWHDDFVESSSEKSPNPSEKIRIPRPKRRVIPVTKIPWNKEFAGRRKKKWWSVDEEDTLRKAVDMYGAGNWVLIKNSYPATFNDRTPVDLKDKWRNMTR